MSNLEHIFHTLNDICFKNKQMSIEELDEFKRQISDYGKVQYSLGYYDGVVECESQI